MKLYISIDLEGVTGIVSPDQVNNNGRDYQYARELMLSDLNAAIEGGFEAGASEILVNDAHDYMTNLLIHKLPRGVKVCLGAHKLYSMMEGFDPKFDGVFMIGYHGRRGTPMAALAHTYALGIRHLEINRQPMSEFSLNALFAGYFQIPSLLLTGDQAIIEEGAALIPHLQTVAVKQALGYRSVMSMTTADSYDLIRDAAVNAIKNRMRIKPYFIEPPYNMSITLQKELYADMVMRLPHTERQDAFTVCFRDRDYISLYKTILSVTGMISSTQSPECF